ncbi:hypothetical protein D3C81_2281090 [compost metagenome]
MFANGFNIFNQGMGVVEMKLIEIVCRKRTAAPAASLIDTDDMIFLRVKALPVAA